MPLAKLGFKRRCGLLAAAAVICFYSGSAEAQTLTEALAATYENNPTLLAARAELRAVNEGVSQANSAWKPDVTLDGSIGYQELKNEPVPGEFQETYPRNVSITVTQPIYQGGSIDANIESAEAVVRAQRALLSDTEQTVLLAAVTAYMDVWRDRAVLDLNRQNEERLARQRQAALERFEVGEITRTDVAQADSRLAGATAARIASEATLERSIAVFRQVIGLEPASIQQPTPAQNLPAGLDMAVAEALERQPELVAARELESSALANVRSRLGDLLPDVSLVAVLSYREQNQFKDTSSTSAQILAQVSFPIYQQGFTFSQVREAKQRANERRLQVVEAARSAEQISVSSWQGLVSAQAQIDSFQAQVNATNIALDGVIQENTVGARTVLDILDAEQEVLNAQVSLVRAQRDEVVASFTLLASVGRLTAANLNLPVAVYDPEVDYDAVRNAWFGLEAPGTP